MLLVVLVAAGALAGALVRGRAGDLAAESEVIPVKVAAARQGRVEKAVRLTGVLTPSHVVPVGSKTGGKIERICVQVGDKVKEGDLLVVFESREARAQAGQAAAAVDAARANLARLEKGATEQEIGQLTAAVDQAQAAYEGARSTCERMKELLAAGIVSQQQYEQAETQLAMAEAQLKQMKDRLAAAQAGAGTEALDAARAQLRQAEAAAQLAQVALSNAELTASLAGVVTETSGEPGQIVGPGTPVVVLATLDPLVVELNLTENLVNQVREGAELPVVVPAVGEGQLAGKVVWVSPAAGVQTRLFKAKVELSNPEGTLKAGMFAEVHLVEQAAEGSVIPQECLLDSSEGKKVFVVKDGVAHERPVSVRAEDGSRCVVDGISEGETVAVAGQYLLRDGAAVRVVGEGE